MKVALLISGYLRSFKLNLPSLRSKIIDKFDNIDVYIHITKNDGDDKYLNDNNECDTITFVTDSINPVCLLYEPNMRYDDNDKVNNVINLWAKYYKLNQIKSLNEVVDDKRYDLVIKYRPDVDILSDINFSILGPNTVYIPKDSKIDKDKLKNVDDPYICDIIAYGNSSAMEKYFKFYEHIKSYIKKCGYVSETILCHYMNKMVEDEELNYQLVNIDYGIILSTCNVFAIAGDSGSGKTMLGNILKKYFSNSIMIECDRYHKWERHDPNWENITHLHPESNYLAKMNEDIFDLKIGKEIHQVNYDHKNGKFTEKEHIESSDNIIICGLHSLYVEKDHLYNLKIFIDTDKSLKEKWKIQRDVIERGYTIDNVKKQISDREEDYEKYVLPQKEKSDIVINFFEENNKLQLRLKFSKKLDLNGILYKSDFSCHYDVLPQIDNKFFEILFKEYIDCASLNVLKFRTYNYYDYILYFLLKI